MRLSINDSILKILKNEADIGIWKNNFPSELFYWDKNDADV